ncbi:hypothetical protein NS234_10170 [Microbacterium oxydans]|uniref:2,3-bisphosphoglycerate-dependent phosphoglycerate mutase n=1 Tax=Microbacterium oxydans TaxID=82380 RepID=UPI00073480C4|nr:2,3-diphosphoglycerate-dependent phosphoglycerate mutase [Microbacterium oxydans]KTR76793.1 hypothetical protein NS234_10170 [Microbacterium oxydans]
MSGTLILLRHGQSTANADGLFTGISNPPLTAEGTAEADTAAQLLLRAGMQTRCCFTSTLDRAINTASRLAAAGATGTVTTDWRLNERNYGALTGRTKTAVREEYGEEAFTRWRRSVTATPPPIPPAALAELRRKTPFRSLPLAALTASESLADVLIRVRAFHQDRIAPTITAGEDLLVVAHGNSLRAYCAVLDDLSDAELRDLNIPTAQPLLYSFSGAGHPDVRGGRYLNPITAHAAATLVAAEGGT